MRHISFVSAEDMLKLFRTLDDRLAEGWMIVSMSNSYNNYKALLQRPAAFPSPDHDEADPLDFYAAFYGDG